MWKLNTYYLSRYLYFCAKLLLLSNKLYFRKKARNRQKLGYFPENSKCTSFGNRVLKQKYRNSNILRQSCQFLWENGRKIQMVLRDCVKIQNVYILLPHPVYSTRNHWTSIIYYSEIQIGFSFDMSEDCWGVGKALLQKLAAKLASKCIGILAACIFKIHFLAFQNFKVSIPFWVNLV